MSSSCIELSQIKVVCGLSASVYWIHYFIQHFKSIYQSTCFKNCVGCGLADFFFFLRMHYLGALVWQLQWKKNWINCFKGLCHQKVSLEVMHRWLYFLSLCFLQLNVLTLWLSFCKRVSSVFSLFSHSHTTLFSVLSLWRGSLLCHSRLGFSVLQIKMQILKSWTCNVSSVSPLICI